MQNFFINKSRFRQIAAILMVLAAVCCIFPPESWSARQLSGHSPQFAVGFLGLAFALLFLGEERLMLVSMGCSAAISFFLNEATEGPFRPGEGPKPDAPRLSVAHFNASESAEKPLDLIKTVLERRPDLVSVQEITPFWDSLLRADLGGVYRSSVSLPQAEFHGIAVFSKTPLLALDTFWTDKMPNLRGAVRPMGFDTTIFFIASIMWPTVSTPDFKRLNRHLGQLSYEANKLGAPFLAFGEYNVVPWAPEVQDFRRATRLTDARQPMKPTVPNGYFEFMGTWLDCLLCSDAFECIRFEELSSETSRHLGIEGVFQLSAKKNVDPKSAPQLPIRAQRPARPVQK